MYEQQTGDNQLQLDTVDLEKTAVGQFQDKAQHVATFLKESSAITAETQK